MRSLAVIADYVEPTENTLSYAAVMAGKAVPSLNYVCELNRVLHTQLLNFDCAAEGIGKHFKFICPSKIDKFPHEFAQCFYISNRRYLFSQKFHLTS